MSDLFDRARAEKTPKKRSDDGTVLELCKTSLPENTALDTWLEAKQREREAKDAVKKSAGVLLPAAVHLWAERFGADEMRPDAPIHVRNIGGRSVTLVFSDCTAKTALKDAAIERLCSMLGGDVFGEITEARASFGIDVSVLDEIADGANAPRDGSTVRAVLSELIGRSRKISDDQKARLFTRTDGVYLVPGTLDALPSICGSASRMGEFLEAVSGPIKASLR